MPISSNYTAGNDNKLPRNIPYHAYKEVGNDKFYDVVIGQPKWLLGIAAWLLQDHAYEEH